MWGISENDKYQELLEAHGVPAESIVTEGLTTNTLAEAQAAIPFFESRGVHVQKLILVSRPIHQRRTFATFRMQHPEIQYINCPADEPLDLEDPETKERLVQEAERLLDYATKGDIEKQEIPLDILKAAAQIRRDLKKEGIYKPRQKPSH